MDDATFFKGIDGENRRRLAIKSKWMGVDIKVPKNRTWEAIPCMEFVEWDLGKLRDTLQKLDIYFLGGSKAGEVLELLNRFIEGEDTLKELKDMRVRRVDFATMGSALVIAKSFVWNLHKRLYKGRKLKLSYPRTEHMWLDSDGVWSIKRIFREILAIRRIPHNNWRYRRDIDDLLCEVIEYAHGSTTSINYNCGAKHLTWHFRDTITKQINTLHSLAGGSPKKKTIFYI